MIFDVEMTAAIRSLFERNGVAGDVSIVSPVTGDEAVFVVSTRSAATMNERSLTEALTQLLGRKVWVATDGPQWRGKTEPLGL